MLEQLLNQFTFETRLSDHHVGHFTCQLPEKKDVLCLASVDLKMA